jgi:D-lactate dehydrogenase
VSIDTGKYIKKLRAQNLSPFAKRVGNLLGDNLGLVCRGASLGLGMVGGIQRLIGDANLGKISGAARSLSRNRIPKWTPAMPGGAKAPGADPVNPYAERRVVYFPSCIARSMGAAKGDPVDDSLTEVTIRVLQKAGYGIIFPQNMKNLCCGTPWESKGFIETADKKSFELEQALLAASGHGAYPVLCDTSPCLYRMRRVMSDTLELYEPVEFVHAFLLDKLTFTPKQEPVAIHPTCSTKKMGLTKKMEEVASQCAQKVIMPPDVNCCGFAGDKGFHLPELNVHGLRTAGPLIDQEGVKVGYSNSRTCEIGCATHIGIPYMSIMYLVDEVTTGAP